MYQFLYLGWQYNYIKPFIKIMCAGVFLMMTGSVSAITLKQNGTTYSIDPATLAIRADNIIVNQPQAPQRVTHLSQSAAGARWCWPQREMDVVLNVANDDLSLEFTTSRPQRFSWFTLPATVKTLLLPLGEGSRVSLEDAHWRQYLLGEMSSLNTNMDLKLPLWSQIQGRRVFSWLLLTPMQNQITFNGEKTLAMAAAHEFDRFNQQHSFKVLLHAGQSALSGALRYRQYLRESGQFRSLKDKINLAPEGKKLIGASYIYLWGNGPLDAADVTNWPGLLDYLSSPPGKPLWDALDKDSRQIIKELKNQRPPQWQASALVHALNQALFSSQPLIKTPDDSDFLLAQKKQTDALRRRAERQLGKFLAPADTWGQGMSVPVIKALYQAGLPRLWLATEKWTAAFMHPPAVELAKGLGYLVAAYDSYDTAIPPGVNDSWLTAQIPAALREKCAIVQADGSKKPGFGRQGYYLNPGCMLPFSQHRMAELVRLAGLNSLFLDVDATGMAENDCNPDHPGGAQQMIDNRNRRMGWFNTAFKLPLGSEDGNAVSAGQIMFAHGTQTWGFGWGDKDMYQDKRSPWYLGAWWPDAQPAFFFAPAKVKEPYRSVIFDPRHRIPLYQAVFHDALISSHHWHADNLKFVEVKNVRSLLSGLYNTAPMFHISRAAIDARLPEILKADGVYRPLHQALWDKALVDFRWLDTDGWVQQTTFSDGTVIIANFGARAFTGIPAQGLRAVFTDGRIMNFAA